jgi:hypothetical protein
MTIMTMMRILVMNMGIHLAVGIVIASMFRTTLCYSKLFKSRYSLLQPDFWEIYLEIMFWPLLLVVLALIFSKSFVDLLCEIGNCLAQIPKDFKKRRKALLKTPIQS